MDEKKVKPALGLGLLAVLLLVAGIVLAASDEGGQGAGSAHDQANPHAAKNFVVQDTADFHPKSEQGRPPDVANQYGLNEDAPIYIFVTNNGQEQNVPAQDDIPLTLTLLGPGGLTQTYPLTIHEGQAMGSLTVRFPAAGQWQIQAVGSIGDKGSDKDTVQYWTNAFWVYYPTKLAVAPNAPNRIPIGGNLQFRATMTYSDNTSQEVTGRVDWTSSDARIAAVDAHGLAAGYASGSVTIRATDPKSGLSDAVPLTVEPLLGLQVIPSSASIQPGATQQLTAKLFYYFFSQRVEIDVTSLGTSWSSSDPSVAAVRADGLVTGVKSGFCSVTATNWLSGILTFLKQLFPGWVEVSDTASITVGTVTGLSVAPNPASVALHKTVSFSAIIRFADGTSVDVTSAASWTSSDPAIATVDNAGHAVGSGLGTCRISAAYQGFTGSASLTVGSKVPAAVAITPNVATLTAAASQQYQAMVTYADGSTEDATGLATWQSSAPAVVTVGTSGVPGSSPGLAQALTLGTAAITADVGGIKGTINVKVIPDRLVLGTAPTLRLRSDTSLSDYTWGYIGEVMDLTATVTAVDRNGNRLSAYDWTGDLASLASASAWTLNLTDAGGQSYAGRLLVSCNYAVPLEDGALQVDFSVIFNKDPLKAEKERIAGFALALQANYHTADGVALTGTGQAQVPGHPGTYTLYGGRIRAANEYFYLASGEAHVYVERYEGGSANDGFVTNDLDRETYNTTQWSLDGGSINTPGFAFRNGIGKLTLSYTAENTRAKVLAPVPGTFPAYLGSQAGILTWGQIVAPPAPGTLVEGPVWEQEDILP